MEYAESHSFGSKCGGGYSLALNTQNYMSIKDIDCFVVFLRRNMKKDIKKINREFAKAKRREWWGIVRAKIRAKFRRKRKGKAEAAKAVATEQPEAEAVKSPEAAGTENKNECPKA